MWKAGEERKGPIFYCLACQNGVSQAQYL